MMYHFLTLSLIGIILAIGATEPPLTNDEPELLGCSCKKKKKSSYKEETLLACEGHDEPLEEEQV